MELLTSNLLSALFVTFFLCVALTPILCGIASGLGLVDRPIGRKRHKGDVPLIGGVAIYAACFSFLWVTSTQSDSLLFNNLLFLLMSAPLVTVGLLDDKFDLEPWMKIVMQVFVSLCMIHFGAMKIDSLGNLFGLGSVELPHWFSVLFTVFCVIGVINAINMIDGVDGLAGLVVLSTLCGLAFMAVRLGDFASLSLALMLVGPIAAYLLFNLRVFGTGNRVFMGDAGSMFLGFGLVWLFIGVTHTGGSAASMSAVAAGWFFGLPLIDIVSVSVARIRKGKSPFSPGRDHVHHHLLDAGIPPVAAVAVLVGFHVSMMLVGFLLDSFRGLEPIGFWAFVAIVVVHHFFTPKLVENISRNTRVVSTEMV